MKMARPQHVIVDVMLVFLMTIFIQVSDSVRTCTNLDNFPFLRRNTQLNNTGIDVLQGLGLVECAAQCKLRKKCRSFSFQHSSGDCKLYEITIGQAGNNVVLKTGIDTSNTDDWRSRIAGPCADHSCSINDVCEPTSRNSKKCVTAYCPSPPVVTKATANFMTSHETTKVGSRLSYTCDVNFHPVGNRTCLPDGTWSNFTCEPDPCPVRDGFVLLDNPQLCFKVFVDSKTAYEARDTCTRLGAKLIVVDTEVKNTAVSEYINSNIDFSVFWIGLTDEQNENKFVWENGNEATFTNWASGKPSGADHDCVALFTSLSINTFKLTLE